MPANLFVISGCSSAGKSSLLEALARAGELVSEEPGRQIVREQLRIGGDALPWSNPQRFIDLCAEHAIREFDRYASQVRRVFFDRSFIDVASAVELTGLVAPASLEEAIRTRRYATTVFIAPPWEDLFEQDGERRHTFADAIAEYAALVPTYQRHGYQVTFLPKASVEERVEFVRATLVAARA